MSTSLCVTSLGLPSNWDERVDILRKSHQCIMIISTKLRHNADIFEEELESCREQNASVGSAFQDKNGDSKLEGSYLSSIKKNWDEQQLEFEDHDSIKSDVDQPQDLQSDDGDHVVA